MRQIILIAHNLRSAHNVGSLLRTADGLGISEVYLTGYTPHPFYANDTRLPHEALKITRRIHKTALGAEDTVKWQHRPDVSGVIAELKARGYKIGALEQSAQSINLISYTAKNKVALLIGNEVTGLDDENLIQSDVILEIPMAGQKESFNVVQATAMALYHLCYCPNEVL